MKCENCGTELNEGILICPKCGEEVWSVPDFDAALEKSIQESITSISNEINQKNRKSKIIKRSIIISLISLLVIGLGSYASFLYYNNSFSVQNKIAQRAYFEGDYQLALDKYQKALEIMPDNENVSLYISYCHYYLGNMFLFEKTAQDIINDNNINDDIKYKAADMLCAYYINQNNYSMLKDIINKSQNLQLNDKYGKYCPEPPKVIDYKEKYEREAIIELECEADEVILYSILPKGTLLSCALMDYEYKDKIELGPGEYTIYALSQKRPGTTSDCISFDVIVEKPNIPEPGLLINDGIINEPAMLAIADHGYMVFYTDDGSEPDINSILYENSIPLHIGKNTYKFIAYENGFYSDILSAEFDLKLNNIISVEEAINIVKDYCSNDNLNERFIYKYMYPVNVIGLGNCFLIDEFFIDIYGIEIPTGLHFAVNYTDGNVQKVMINGSEFEIHSVQ